MVVKRPLNLGYCLKFARILEIFAIIRLVLVILMDFVAY